MEPKPLRHEQRRPRPGVGCGRRPLFPVLQGRRPVVPHGWFGQLSADDSTPRGLYRPVRRIATALCRTVAGALLLLTDLTRASGPQPVHGAGGYASPGAARHRRRLGLGRALIGLTISRDGAAVHHPVRSSIHTYAKSRTE